MPEKSIRVVVAEPIRYAMSGLLSELEDAPEIEVIAQASTGAEALQALREHRPDIAILDYSMPEMSGLQVMTAIKNARETASIKVIFLTSENRSEIVYKAMSASDGAHGYVLKEDNEVNIVETVRRVARGRIIMCQGSTESLVLEMRSGPRAEGPPENPRLTARQSEVLTLMAKGLSAKEVAAELGLALGTVKSHTRGAYTRLEVRSAAAAIREAMRLGLIDHYQARRRDTV